jgi:hypothetical protein
MTPRYAGVLQLDQRAHALFGDRLHDILEELTEALTA